MKTKTRNNERDSVPNYLPDRALFPLRDRSRSTHKWAYNGFANLHELGAQLFWLHQKTKVTTPKGKRHACCLFSMLLCHVSLSSKVEKGRFSSGQRGSREEKVILRPVVQPKTTRRVRPEIRPTVPIYLNEFPG